MMSSELSLRTAACSEATTAKGFRPQKTDAERSASAEADAVDAGRFGCTDGWGFAVCARQHDIDDEARQRQRFVDGLVSGQDIGRVRADHDQALIRALGQARVEPRQARVVGKAAEVLERERWPVQAFDGRRQPVVVDPTARAGFGTFERFAAAVHGD
jgi:hypothetical protein